MADLQIPNLNKKSNKYLFKKKLSLRRKSKKKLLTESLYMLIFCVFLVYINYLIPNKELLFKNSITNFEKSFITFVEFFTHIYKLFLVFFIAISLLLALIMFLGSIYRIYKVLRRKAKFFSYK